MTPRDLAARIVLVAALFGTLAGLSAHDSYAAPAEYVPFVTDFPKPAERYVPFVSDFPRPTVSPTPAQEPEPTGIDWTGISLEGSLGAVLAASLAAAGLVLARRRHTRPPLHGC